MVSSLSGAPKTRQITVDWPFGPTESFCPGSIRWAGFALSLLILFTSALRSLEAGWDGVYEEKSIPMTVYTRRKHSSAC